MYTHIYGSEGKYLIPQKVLYIGLHNLLHKSKQTDWSVLQFKRHKVAVTLNTQMV